jgi:hypothetical protein
MIEQYQRHQAQLTQQILNALQCDEMVAELPENLQGKIPMQSLADVSYVEAQLDDQVTFRNLVSLLQLICHSRLILSVRLSGTILSFALTV